MKTAELTARTFPLHAVPDLLDYYDPAAGFYLEHRGGGVVGVGQAARIEVAPGPDHVSRIATSARALLSSIRAERDAVPVLVGALPFDGSGGCALVVPALCVVRRGDRAWLVEVGRAGTALPEQTPHEPPPEPWDTLRIEPDGAPADYVAAVRRARERIAAGELRKVVLARTVVARSDHPFDVPALLERLRRTEPDAFVFAADGFIGASPELLVERWGSRARAVPLAGTAARRGDDDEVARALLASDKDREEHRITVEAVRAALADVCETVEAAAEPHAVRTSAVWHLATEVRGTLRATHEDALALAALLHPTPAVCGTPREEALALIGELEPRPRGLYAGTVGWMDARGDGEWAVSLRCADVRGSRARLYAGAGIVAASDPDSELAETDAKLAALLDALRYG